MERLNYIELQLEATPDKQIPLTNPDARSMKSAGNGMVGYNEQTAVDVENHLIVAHEVNNVGNVLISVNVLPVSALKLSIFKIFSSNHRNR